VFGKIEYAVQVLTITRVKRNSCRETQRSHKCNFVYIHIIDDYFHYVCFKFLFLIHISECFKLCNNNRPKKDKNI